MNPLTLKQISFALLLAFALGAPTAFAQSKAAPKPAPETDQERMQRQLNEQVMAAPFSVEDTAKIDAYVKNAMEKNLKPQVNPPAYWRRGYTCANIYSYGWRAYGDCTYYHRYYGRYWY
jgi:hypothetical protein